MANFETIKTTIDANINTNGNQAITGAVMNSVLKQMVDSTDAELAKLSGEIDHIKVSFDTMGNYENVSSKVGFVLKKGAKIINRGVTLITAENAALDGRENISSGQTIELTSDKVVVMAGLTAGLVDFDYIVTESFKKIEDLSEKFDLNFNQNIEPKWRVGYEIGANGEYVANGNYTSSPNMYVGDDLLFNTNYNGNIYCYSSEGTLLGRVWSNLPLLDGTSYVRINWQTSEAPYFYTSLTTIELINIAENHALNKISETDNYIAECITDNYNLNDAKKDLIGYELLSSDGGVAKANGWKVSNFVKIESGYKYTSNLTGYYYFYDANMTFIKRVYISAGAFFSTANAEGASFVRLNTNSENPFEIKKFDLDGNPILIKRVFNGDVAELDNTNAFASFAKLEGATIKSTSRNIEIRFSTIESIYKFTKTKKLFGIDGVLTINLEKVDVGDSYYIDSSSVNIAIHDTTKTQYIPLRINNYGENLFSIRAKYPVVSVDNEGNTEIVTYLPTFLESCYISKNDTHMTIYKNDGSVYESFALSNYSDVSALVDAMMMSDTLSEHFEVKKYGGEGVTFDQINNFDRVYLVREHTEYLYGGNYSAETGATNPILTGKVYWDSYPTIIKTSDVGYEHVLRINYKVVDKVITYIYCSIDGMYVRFSTNIPCQENAISYNADIINNARYSEYPYKPIVTPMLSMLHNVVEGNSILGQSMNITTFRLNSILSYLKKKGFVAQNFNECISTIKGENAVDCPTYCLTFDDMRKHLWTNSTIRNILNQYRAKPTLVYIIEGKDLDGNTPPSSAPSPEEYKAMKNSGWDIVPHGFSAYTNLLSYAQFVHGFVKTQEKWLEWYGECPIAYNPHAYEPVDYQYYLMQLLGFSVVTSGSAPLGWYCEAGTTINLEYKRVTWMDGELDWEIVTNNIDQFVA